MTIDELNAKYGKPVGATQNSNPFGFTTPPPAKTKDNSVVSAFKSGVDQTKQGYNEAVNAQNPGQLLEGSIGAASGAINSVVGPAMAAVNPLAKYINPLQPATDLVGKGLEAVQNKVTDNPTLQNFAQSQTGQNVARGAKVTSDLANITGAVAGGMELAPKIADTASNIATKTSEVASNIKSKVANTTGNIKEAIKPSLTPEEATGQIIQGEKADIPAANRTFKALNDTSAIKTHEDLSSAIDKQIIKPGLKQVDAAFAKDTTGGHSIKSFEQTVGKGKSAVKVNYVQDAIDQLKNFYTKTGDAQGVSDMKALENKAKINGLTYGDINKLAREHGATLNAYNANGELASGLTKQSAENTRLGLKTTARNGLGTPEAKALDKKVSEAIETKKLIDEQAKKVNAKAQKNVKVGAIPKVAGTLVKTVGHPIDTLSRLTGVSGAGLDFSPIELQSKMPGNLKVIRGK